MKFHVLAMSTARTVIISVIITIVLIIVIALVSLSLERLEFDEGKKINMFQLFH